MRMWIIAAILLMIGVVWPLLVTFSPTFAVSGFAISIINFVSNPLTWFTVLMVVLIASSLIPAMDRWKGEARLSGVKVYGLIAAMVLLILIAWIVPYERSPQSTVALRRDPGVASPPTLPPPEEQVRPKQQPPPRPTNLTLAQIWQIKFASLSIPRSCFVKITAAPGDAGFRVGFRDALADTFVRSFQEDHTMGSIGICKFIQDDKDSSPDLYAEELNHMPPEIVINGAGANTAVIEFLVGKVREATNSQLRVRVGTTKPSVDIADTWIYVQIGAGSLWNER